MAILEGTTEDGALVPVQVTDAGRIVAEGLQGPEGPQGPQGPKGDKGDKGDPGAPGNLWSGSNPGDIYYEGGNVGIGTSTPGAQAEISQSTGGDPILRIRDEQNVQTGSFSIDSDLTIDLRGGNAASAFSFTSGTDERARIDRLGRLLLGVESSNATERLIVQGNSSNQSGYAAMLVASGDDHIPNNNSIGNIEFSDSTHERSVMLRAESDTASWSSTDHGSKLAFHTTSVGSSTAQERLVIESDGDVLFQGAPVIKSPNGNQWRIVVDNSGLITTVPKV